MGATDAFKTPDWEKAFDRVGEAHRRFVEMVEQQNELLYQWFDRAHSVSKIMAAARDEHKALIDSLLVAPIQQFADAMERQQEMFRYILDDQKTDAES